MNPKEIDDLLSETMRKIADAARKYDLETVSRLTNHATELQELKRATETVRQRVDAIRQGVAVKSAAISTTPSMRELPVEVSQGMINQNLLTLTAHVKSGRVQQGEDFIVETKPLGEKFRTTLMANGNKFQERGAIGRFYEKAGVRGGDIVILTEIARGVWTLSKAPAGKHLNSTYSVLAEYAARLAAAS